ncbi:MAG: thioredoxin family protein [Planctomycetota bacterium]|nr:thioredoxin family protein [Planctomycetota bacterium]
MGPQLEDLAEETGGFVIRKIDIDEWGSDVARQYNIRRLPTLWLYDGDELVSKDTREIIQVLSD